MFKIFKESLNQRKVQIFLLFLIVAFLLRLVSKLSDKYTEQRFFWVEYTQQPDSIFIQSTTLDRIPVRLRASGFSFLSHAWSAPSVQIDLSRISYRNKKYFVPKSDFIGQIEDQLPGSMELLDIGVDTLFIEYVAVIVKEVPVQLSADYLPAQNHLIEGGVQVEPKKIRLKGPASEIDSIQAIPTIYIQRPEVTDDFEYNEGLYLNDGLKYTVFEPSTVRVSGTVYRFSEKILELPVSVLNIPPGTEIKTFPEQVKVLCRARRDRLKSITADDFSVIADYEQISSDQLLQVSMRRQPQDVPSIQLLDPQLEFILRRL